VSRIALLTAASLVAGLALATPASAQDDERVNQVIVYGNDACPRSTSPDEITVCARKAESERYRIPEPLRGIDKPESRAWTDRVLAYETVGNTGTLSCTPIGPGGYTGCTQNFIHNAYAEKRNGTDVKFGELIAAERARRLSTIDRDAAAEQSRVEQAEKDYDAQSGNRTDTDTQAQTDARTPSVSPLPAGH
jgi:hypothetical protein